MPNPNGRARVPDFLVIGAMKSGTTSLFFDLSTHPAIFFPDVKEPHGLASDRVLTAEGRGEYEALFQRATADQVCGEASTGYSKLPDVPGVVERALRVCGPDLRVLYLVREPVARIISHHHHEVTAGAMTADIEHAVREHPQLLDYSRYAFQVAPWIAALGRDRVKILRFESYVDDRQAAVAEIAHFLGLEPATSRVETDRVYNRGVGKPAPRGLLWRWSRGSSYRRWVRPLLSRRARAAVMRLLLPKAPARPAPPSLETVDWILENLEEDQARLREIVGAEAPLWDPSVVRRRYPGVAGGKARPVAEPAGGN